MEGEWIRKRDVMKVLNNTEASFKLAASNLEVSQCSPRVVTELLSSVEDRIDAIKGRRLDDGD